MKWIHSVYLGDKDWWSYEAPNNSSWYWQQVVIVKNKFRSSPQFHHLMIGTYQIAQGYNVLLSSHDRLKLQEVIWGRLNIPKHSFIIWLAVLNRLHITERLYRYNISPDKYCCICGIAEETINHLFFDCCLSTSCLEEMKHWLGWRVQNTGLLLLLRKIEKARMSKFRNQVWAATMAGLVYALWRTRNEAYWKQRDAMKHSIVQKVKREVKY
ncbi:uncharacterized protein LOC133831981 [Humulus lupulus]|uniref:uncharacterized protein LOC133831981 n=1 Tax=Humulus lupulus TaxID=3486 RepID=UPI002B40D723|nr:uncharacterized protein LOC133831981 [Humulus lupulus]